MQKHANKQTLNSIFHEKGSFCVQTWFVSYLKQRHSTRGERRKEKNDKQSEEEYKI